MAPILMQEGMGLDPVWGLIPAQALACTCPGFGCIWGANGDISSKPFLDKLRNEPRVVQVNVGEEETMDLVWRNGEGLPVSVGIVLFLKQSAVDEDLHSARIQKIA